MKFSHILILLLVVVAVGFAVYWFFLKPKSTSPPNNTQRTLSGGGSDTNKSTTPSPDRATNSSTDGPSSAGTNESQLPSTKKSQEWKNFKENKKINLNKFKQDFAVNAKNKLQPEEFSEIMARPCDIDKSLFEPDKIQTLGRKTMTPYESLTFGVTQINQIDINVLDNVDNFDDRGFKNINDFTVEDDDTKNVPDVELVNSELFGV